MMVAVTATAAPTADPTLNPGPGPRWGVRRAYDPDDPHAQGHAETFARRKVQRVLDHHGESATPVHLDVVEHQGAHWVIAWAHVTALAELWSQAGERARAAGGLGATS